MVLLLEMNYYLHWYRSAAEAGNHRPLYTRSTERERQTLADRCGGKCTDGKRTINLNWWEKKKKFIFGCICYIATLSKCFSQCGNSFSPAHCQPTSTMSRLSPLTSSSTTLIFQAAHHPLHHRSSVLQPRSRTGAADSSVGSKNLWDICDNEIQ